jgi:hypothetical protein
VVGSGDRAAVAERGRMQVAGGSFDRGADPSHGQGCAAGGLRRGKAGSASDTSDAELEAARAEIARLEEAVKEQAIELVVLPGEIARGLVGPRCLRACPPRTRQACSSWSTRPGPVAGRCGAALRCWAWLVCGAIAGWLAVTPAGWMTPAPAATPCTGVLDWETEEILALFEEWGEIDGSYRKLAHRGSYLHRVWVSASSVWRVLSAHGKVLPARPRPEPTPKKPWPDWVELRPNHVWG